MEARDIIYKEYGNSKNILTPRRLSYGKLSKNIAYELSSGSGLNRMPIWGISIATWLPKEQKTQRLYKLSKCCHSKEEVKSYIQSLKYQIKEKEKKQYCSKKLQNKKETVKWEQERRFISKTKKYIFIHIGAQAVLRE